MKIISGGQSGVDRAALDFALNNCIPCGGWCPKGRLAEDGPIDQRYPLQETLSSNYALRTRLNVDEGDATLILYTDGIGNGTALTAEYAKTKNKPLLLLNIHKEESLRRLKNWLEQNKFEVLNIAGPRESTSPRIYQKALKFLNQTFA